MTRNDIINTIGSKYLQSNIENGEWSYGQALKKAGKTIDVALVSDPKTGKVHKNLDLRFVDKKQRIAVLVETKQNYDKVLASATTQLQAYVEYEKVLTGYKIIAILANTKDDDLIAWQDEIATGSKIESVKTMLSFEELKDAVTPTKNNREEVMRNTFELNEKMHGFGIEGKLRSQLVGTCLLALKHHTQYKNLTTKQILAGIKDVLSDLLDSKDLHKAGKLAILNDKVLNAQSIRTLKSEEMQCLMEMVEGNILPYINEKSTQGQDLLNLFFTIFNKYVGKLDKNQAFTPDHIVHFMCRVIGINRNSRVLDPCCGSGAFLVRALTDALADCKTEKERELVKKEHIYGIEAEENAFGLATTNMLIHGDGNSNIMQQSCFKLIDWIEDAHIDRVLMNPPYNAQRNYCKPEYVEDWDKDQKEDPSKGFHYVYEVAKAVKTGKLAVLLPMQCAIGNSPEIRKYKKLMLEEHTLDAVFSLPFDIFHPGASASACCMVFNLGERHSSAAKETFFGYYKYDGFAKKKNLGRVELLDKKTGKGMWAPIEAQWLDLYHHRKVVPGLSAVRVVDADDEWLCEAYMDTDYSALNVSQFKKNVRNFYAYRVSTGIDAEPESNIDPTEWKEFSIGKLFSFENGRTKHELLEPGDDCVYIGAKKTENGVMQKCAYNPQLAHKGNCIVFICNGEGSIGYANYMDRPFLATSDVTLGYNAHLNPYVGMFLVTVIDCERPKYSYGRKWRPRLKETVIRLPAKGDEPDWKYMEDFIKNLPFGTNIGE